MNKKEYKKIKLKELEDILTNHDAAGITRLEIANAIGVGESTLRRWLRDGKMPTEAWEKILSPEFKQHIKHSGMSRKHWHQFYETSDQRTSIKQPTQIQEGTIDELKRFNLDLLVDEIESRGWNVQLSRKTE